MNHHLGEDQPTVFATVGNNRVTVYEAITLGDIPNNNKLIQCYTGVQLNRHRALFLKDKFAQTFTQYF